MTTQPPPPSGQAEPRPIQLVRRFEVRCERCNWHLVTLSVYGGVVKVEKTCPNCHHENVRFIHDPIAA